MSVLFLYLFCLSFDCSVELLWRMLSSNHFVMFILFYFFFTLADEIQTKELVLRWYTSWMMDFGKWSSWKNDYLNNDVYKYES